MYQQNPTYPPQSTVKVHWSRVVFAGLALLAVAAYLVLNGGEEPKAVTDQGNARVAPIAAQPKIVVPKESKPKAASPGRKRAAKRRAAARRAAAAATAAATAKPAAAAQAKATNANGAGAEALPYTGAPAWLAALFGAILLTGGVMMQRRAEDVGVFATTHQRGPLLRAQSYVAAAFGARQRWHLAAYLGRTHAMNFVREWRAATRPPR